MITFTYEHHRQGVLPFKKFLLRMGRHFLLSILLILVSLLIGIAGYSIFNDSGLLDSFYMSCMILTGMGPVVDMTTAGAKLFSSIYALYSGIVFLTVSAVLFSPVVHRILHILHVEKEDEAKM